MEFFNSLKDSLSKQREMKKVLYCTVVNINEFIGCSYVRDSGSCLRKKRNRLGCKVVFVLEEKKSIIMYYSEGGETV